MNSISKILADTKSYYDNKIILHDATPAGVDWNSLESQVLRFQKLLELCDLSKTFSINDVGCGYGALYEYLSNRSLQFNYCGIDISEAMLEKARQNYHNQVNCTFKAGLDCMELADYSVASGIFNVKLACEKSEWQSYILWVLDNMNQVSRKGFAFNCLTTYSDIEYMRNDLYYGDPCYFFDYCKKRYAKNVALIHDYGLYEFTIIVRKEL